MHQQAWKNPYPELTKQQNQQKLRFSFVKIVHHMTLLEWLLLEPE